MRKYRLDNQLFPLMHPLAIFILFFFLSAGIHAAIPFGTNLMPNPGFEETVSPSQSAQGKAGQLPGGWKLVIDKPDSARLTTAEKAVAEGKLCLSLEISPPDIRGKQLSLYSPGVACEPGWYLASFWYRHEFASKEQPSRLVYVERLLDIQSGRRDDVIYHYFHDRPAVNGQWDYTFIMFRIRPEQKGVRFLFSSFGKETRLMLDNFKLRRLDGTALSATPVEPPTLIKTGIAADPITDPAASEGRAWRCEEGKHVAGAKITSRAQSTVNPGLYRLRFRIRQEKPSSRDALHLAGSGDNGAGFDFLRTADFSGISDYEEFTVFWFYPFGGGHGFNWRFPGSGIYRFDNVIAEKVANITMPEAWTLLAEGINSAAIQPTGLTPANKPVVLISGLTEHHIGIESALAASGLDAYRCHLNTIPGGKIGLTPDLPSLEGVRLLIIADAPSRILSPDEQLCIRQFVNNGGKLIVFGGLLAFGQGGMKGSCIEEIMPVSIKRTFDRIKIPESKGEFKENKSLLPTSFGNCQWIHDVDLKEKAEVLANTDGKPAVVQWKYGKGKVVAITATVLGEPKNPFWENQKWKDFLLEIIK
jgi:hypothetical protein